MPCLALVVKHGNACGAGMAYNRLEAIRKMTAGDPQAMFGGTAILNFPVLGLEADRLLYDAKGQKRLFDVIVAPSFGPEAIEMLSRKKDKCRFVTNDNLLYLSHNLDQSPVFRHVRGGFLEQPNYSFVLDINDPDLKKYGQSIVAEEESDMLLAKAICDTSNSNTITIVRNEMLLANGVGQQSRVNGAELAILLAKKNGHDLQGAIAASDSFFPFTDGPAVLIKAGIKGIISSSGSVKDSEVIAYCLENGVALYLIPDAKGRGFFNH